MNLILTFIGVILLSLQLRAQIKPEKEQLEQVIKEFGEEEKYRNKSYKEQFLIASNLYYRSKEIGFNYGVIFGLQEMSRSEIQMGNLSSCLKLAKEGLELAEKNNRISEHVTLLRYAALSMADQGYYLQSKSHLFEAANLSDKIADINERHWIKLTLFRSLVEFYSGVYNKEKVQKDSALFYLKKGYEESRKISSNSMYFRRAQILGDIESIYIIFYSLDIKNKEVNLRIAEDKLDKLYSIVRDANHQDKIATIYLLYSDIEKSKGNFDRALMYCEKSIPILKHFHGNFLNHNVYNKMSELYARKGEYKKEAYFLKMAKFLEDSVHTEEKEAIMRSFPFVLESAQSEKFDLSYLFYFLFIGLVILTITVIKFRLKRSIDHNLSHLKLSESILVNQSVSKQVIQEPLDKAKLLEVINLAKVNNELFLMSFLELNPSFKDKLLSINPRFSIAECEFCALLKLNFDTKQIARYRNLSIRSVDSKKYRIRKKLGLRSEDDLYDYFMEF